MPHCLEAVSYTHLRAHETDTSLFVGSVQMCIRDSSHALRHSEAPDKILQQVKTGVGTDERLGDASLFGGCLLYTSPSPRDGHLSIRRQRPDVYKRQQPCLASFGSSR